MSRLPVLLLLGACADITPIEDGATHGPVTTLQDWFTSAQLVQSDAGVALFDAGFRPGRMETALADQGLSPDDVTHVFLTHAHGDHVGALSLYSNAVVHAIGAEEEVLAEEAPEASLDVELQDGEVLPFGVHSIEVFAVPGHTPGSAAYLVGGVLILGDAALITSGGELTPVAEARSEDPVAAAQALVDLAERLEPRAAEVTHLVPAHSGAAAGAEPLFTYAGVASGR